MKEEKRQHASKNLYNGRRLSGEKVKSAKTVEAWLSRREE